jgi:hypothetical protein
MSKKLYERRGRVGRPECNCAVLVTHVEDCVVGVLFERGGGSKAGWDFDDNLTS